MSKAIKLYLVEVPFLNRLDKKPAVHGLDATRLRSKADKAQSATFYPLFL